MTDHIDTDGIFEEEPEALPPVAPEIQAYLNASKEMLKEAFDRIPERPSYGVIFPEPPELEWFCTIFYKGCFNELGELLNKGWRIHNYIPRPCGTEFQILFILCKEKESKPDA